MKIYLDDDSAARHLIRLLRSAGHDAVTSIDAGMLGRADPIHLVYSIRNQRVLLTANHDDFEMLHNLIVVSGGHHYGILAVCKENIRHRDMSPHAIVRAIANLMAAGIDLRDDFQVLNHWR